MMREALALMGFTDPPLPPAVRRVRFLVLDGDGCVVAECHTLFAARNEAEREQYAREAVTHRREPMYIQRVSPYEVIP